MLHHSLGRKQRDKEEGELTLPLEELPETVLLQLFAVFSIFTSSVPEMSNKNETRRKFFSVKSQLHGEM